MRFGAAVHLVDEPGRDCEFVLGAEMIDPGTGTLNSWESLDVDGDGTAFEAGDVIFGKLRPYLRKAWLANRTGQAIGDLHVYRPTGGHDARFIRYFVLSSQFSDLVTASTYGAKMPRANWSFIKTVPYPDFDLARERAIADFLDRETAKIDALIQTQWTFAAGLARRRTALQADGVEVAIGDGTRLRYVVRERDQRVGSAAAELPLLSVSIKSGTQIANEEVPVPPEERRHYKYVAPGDIVLNRMRAFQGGLGLATTEGMTSPDYAVLTPNSGVLAGWLDMVMRSPRFISEMTSRIRGIGTTDSGAVRTPRINVSDLGEIRLRVPDLADQEATVRSAQAKVAEVNRLGGLVERHIALARERRSALITAAVTGQLEIPAA